MIHKTVKFIKNNVFEILSNLRDTFYSNLYYAGPMRKGPLWTEVVPFRNFLFPRFCCVIRQITSFEHNIYLFMYSKHMLGN